PPAGAADAKPTATTGSGGANTADKPCPNEISDNDKRCSMELSFYLGVAVDTFAAGDTRRYLNPGDSAGKDERFVGGFDFGFRLWGKQQEGTKKQDAESKPKYYTRQLWIYGETVHGVRSAEIDCKAHSDFPTCKDLLTPNDLTTNPAGHLIYLLRN